MFDGIAPRYDLLNRLMSFGADRRWRRAAASALALRPGATVLDLATGTADLAIEIARTWPGSSIIALDPSSRMLDVARKKVVRAGLSQRIRLVRGRAEDLPFRDEKVDGCTMAFGIRNIVDRSRALAETARATATTGRIVILELSEPDGVLGALARLHIRRIVPRLGAFLSGAREYRYLRESIAAFPTPGEFAALMGRSALHVQDVLPLTFGVCHLYVGRPAR